MSPLPWRKRARELGRVWVWGVQAPVAVPRESPAPAVVVRGSVRGREREAWEQPSRVRSGVWEVPASVPVRETERGRGFLRLPEGSVPAREGGAGSLFLPRAWREVEGQFTRAGTVSTVSLAFGFFIALDPARRLVLLECQFTGRPALFSMVCGTVAVWQDSASPPALQ